jgi:ABC-2 type transport system permease protein
MVANNVLFTRALVTTNLKATLALRGAFVIQALFMALNNFTYFVFWWALLARVPSLRGWRLGDIELLFGVVAVVFGLTVSVAGGVRHLARFIEDGSLDTLLTQPKPVLIHALGMRAQPSGIGDVLSGVVFIVWSGQVSWRTMPWLVVVMAASALILAACGVVFFSLGFWLGRVETVAAQLWELMITFALYPEPLFGGALRLALFTVLPAGLVGYLPVRVIQTPTLAGATMLWLGAIGYVCVAAAMFNRGLRRYASGNGFTMFG